MLSDKNSKGTVPIEKATWFSHTREKATELFWFSSLQLEPKWNKKNDESYSTEGPAIRDLRKNSSRVHQWCQEFWLMRTIREE